MKMKIKSLFAAIKLWIGFFTKPLSERRQNENLRSRSKYAKYYKSCKLNPNMVLYESFFGRGMLCNPYAIFKQLLADPSFGKYIHIWTIDDPDDLKMYAAEYAKYKNVRFVEYKSDKYMKYLCEAKYVINNSTFPAFYTKKEGQIYINTWHGIPVKSMGYDEPDGAVSIANTMRNFLLTDYLISSGPVLTEMYTGSAYKLKGLLNAKLIDEGYPRLDLLYNTDRAYIINKLKKSGIKLDDNKKIVLYAPTWRGKSFSDVNENVSQFFNIKRFFDKEPQLSGYQLLVKVHQSVFQKAKSKMDPSFMVPATIDANELLSVTDVLISDYSSIFFDFVATRRPTIFYIPDIKEYTTDRGMYVTADKLPGPCASSFAELKNILLDLDNSVKKHENVYNEIYNTCCNFDNGNISKRVIDIIFRNNTQGYNVTDISQPEKKKILFIRGDMRVNGISTALLNLLNNIDYSKFDVTVMVMKPADQLQNNLVRQINPNVRVLVRNSTKNVTFFEDVAFRITERYALKGRYKKYFKPEVFRKEFIRSFGTQHYDYILDFDGYNLFFGLVAAHNIGAKCGIWMHNDMVSERNVRFKWLDNIFSIYPKFDFLISCSQAIMKVNKNNLAYLGLGDKFRYAKNTIDLPRILQGAEDTSVVEYENVSYCPVHLSESDISDAYKMIPLTVPPIEAKMTVRGSETFKKDELADGSFTVDIPKKGMDFTPYRFATVGRLSPEKNHVNLIKAFTKFVTAYPCAILYLLGEGPDRKKLETLITNNHMEKNIILTGNVKNPFALLKQCDCFILPSLHEGQPMVIHEARVLRLPIIVSNFSSVEGSVYPKGQLVIGTGVNDIYDSLIAFTENKVPNSYVFDADKYNSEAYDEFLCAIGEK